MNDLRQAAEQALKVLEEINEISKAPMGLPLPAEIDNSMENLRQALAQPEWVGLTEEDFYKKDDELVFVLGMKFAAARLKEKNTWTTYAKQQSRR